MKWFLIILGAPFLMACALNEVDFKSQVPAHQPIVSANLNVPFYPQAPDADWSLPWQEACEEASVILAYYGATGKDLTRDEFREELLKIIDWERANFGHYEHTDIAETARILEGYYGYRDFEIAENPSADDLKGHLAQGHLIVAPFAGRKLGNPFYRGEGPLYHMLVIKGYDEKRFITNDVGTRRGENFIYQHDTLMNAMHDWNNEDINFGARKVIVLKGID